MVLVRIKNRHKYLLWQKAKTEQVESWSNISCSVLYSVVQEDDARKCNKCAVFSKWEYLNFIMKQTSVLRNIFCQEQVHVMEAGTFIMVACIMIRSPSKKCLWQWCEFLMMHSSSCQRGMHDCSPLQPATITSVHTLNWNEIVGLTLVLKPKKGFLK